MKLIIIALLFLTGCSSLPKEIKSAVVAPVKEDVFYNAICYSFKSKEYSYISKSKLVNVSEEGVKVQPDGEDAFVVKQECLLERTNFTPVLTGTESKISFVCAMDDVGDIVFQGEGFLVLQFYGNNVISLYDSETKRELIVWKNKCSVVEQSDAE